MSLKAADRMLPWDLVLRGDALECPCCGGTFKRFRSMNGRPNARCPACDALERHRVLWLYLRDRTDILTTPQRLLHFAAEPGFEDRLRAIPTLDYASADLEPKNSFQQRVDITAMPYEDASWDTVMANHVFVEIPDDAAAMREVFRVLKPGGRLIAQVNIDHDSPVTIPAERGRVGHVAKGSQQWVGRNVRRYGEDYPDRLRAAGFEVDFVPYVRELPAESVDRHALEERGGKTTGNDIYIGIRPSSI